MSKRAVAQRLAEEILRRLARLTPLQRHTLLNPVDRTLGGRDVIARYPVRTFDELRRQNVVDWAGALTPQGDAVVAELRKQGKHR